jgi:hypothetical protein
VINYISPERGDNTVGVTMYLFGPGRYNEHRDQRVIAAADPLGFDDGTRLDIEADREEILALGQSLDSHRRAMGIQMRGGHVWHCSLSLPPHESTPERRLSDEQWAEAARYVVKRMGFDDPDSSKAACRWLAVHHGPSVGGNEHIHLIVNLVREDGTFASIWNDRRTMSRITAELEKQFGLQHVRGRDGGGMPGLTRAEIERARRHGDNNEPDRLKLARIVRGCATAAADEADFVQRLRESGVMVRPRYAPGGRTAVVGYSVARKPAPSGPAAARDPRRAGVRSTSTRTVTLWFGGGRLGSDLSLPRLRESWNSTPDEAARYVSAWGRTRPRSTPRPRYTAEVWDQAMQVLVGVREQLASVPVDDVATWAAAAHQAAGVLAAWSTRLEPDRPGPLAAAADVLAASAQTRHGEARARPRGRIKDLRGVAMVMAAVSGRADQATRQAMLIRQITRLMQALHDMHLARGQAAQAAALAEVARTKLVHLHQRSTVSSLTPIPALAPRSGGGFGVAGVDRDTTAWAGR